jgi:hypothetical protein
LFEFHVISVDAQCITTVIMNVIARGDCALAAKKNYGAITLSKFKFELAGNGNQQLVLERWTDTRWFQPSRWFQGTEQAVQRQPSKLRLVLLAYASERDQTR